MSHSRDRRGQTHNGRGFGHNFGDGGIKEVDTSEDTSHTTNKG